jgi:hypothetical protein
MSKAPISPLRQRMIDDMRVRKFGQRSSAARRLTTCAAIRCIKARRVSARQRSIAPSLHYGSSSG